MDYTKESPIDDEIFMDWDTEEATPYTIYIEEKTSIFHAVDQHGNVRLFRFTVPFEEIENNHKAEVLAYRGHKPTEELYSIDVFIHGKYIEEFGDRVEFNRETKALTIHFENYGADERNYDALFDFLGDKDIVTASELGQDTIAHNGDIYYFTHMDDSTLARDGRVTLSFSEETVDDFKESHPDFYDWYYNEG